MACLDYSGTLCKEKKENTRDRSEVELHADPSSTPAPCKKLKGPKVRVTCISKALQSILLASVWLLVSDYLLSSPCEP